MAREKSWHPKKTVNHLVRRWLNPLAFVRGYGSQGGFIVTQFMAKKGDHNGTRVNIRIADCTRSVDLDLEADTPEERDRAVCKLTILVDEITVLRDKVESLEFDRK